MANHSLIIFKTNVTIKVRGGRCCIWSATRFRLAINHIKRGPRGMGAIYVPNECWTLLSLITAFAINHFSMHSYAVYRHYT